MLFSLPCVASMMTVLFLYIAFVCTFGDNTQFIFHRWSYDIDLAMYCYLRDKCCHGLACIVSVIMYLFLKCELQIVRFGCAFEWLGVIAFISDLQFTWFLSWWQKTFWKTQKDVPNYFLIHDFCRGDRKPFTKHQRIS